MEEEVERKRRKHSSEVGKLSIIAYANLFRDSETKKFQYGKRDVVAKAYDISPSFLNNIVASYDREIENGVFFPSFKAGYKGGKAKLTDIIREKLYDLHYLTEGSCSFRSLAVQYYNEFGSYLSPTSLYRYYKKMGIVLLGSYLKPLLKDKHLVARAAFILTHIEHAGHGVYRFLPLKNWVHVDEKWFYMESLKTIRKKLPEEDRQDDDTTQHKNAIRKIMFLCAVGVPQSFVDANGEEKFFDGKLGIWPFSEEVAAVRGSVNRPRGTIELKPVNVNHERYFEKMELVFASIREKMAFCNEVFVQQDGAGPHVGHGVLGRLEDAGNNGQVPRIHIKTQPAQSPDLNKLDLCLFNSMNKEAQRIKADNKTYRDLQNAVIQTFEDYDWRKLERVHAFQFEVYRKILENRGGNQYKLPHSGVRERQNEGAEVCNLSVTAELVNIARQIANDIDSDSSDEDEQVFQ